MALRDKSIKNKSEIYKNLGNSYFKKKKYKEAIKAYKNSLMADSKNEDARINYELTSKMLQRQQQKKQQQKKQQKQQ